jgi:hypothetical protein
MKVARVRCLSPKEPAEVQATDPCRDPRGVRTAAGRLQVVAGPWRLQRAGAFARAMRTSPGMRKGSSWATRIGTGERAPRHTRHLQDTASIEQGRWPGASLHPAGTGVRRGSSSISRNLGPARLQPDAAAFAQGGHGPGGEILEFTPFFEMDCASPEDVVPSGAAAPCFHPSRFRAAPAGSRTADAAWPAVSHLMSWIPRSPPSFSAARGTGRRLPRDEVGGDCVSNPANRYQLSEPRDRSY